MSFELSIITHQNTKFIYNQNSPLRFFFLFPARLLLNLFLFDTHVEDKTSVAEAKTSLLSFGLSLYGIVSLLRKVVQVTGKNLFEPLAEFGLDDEEKATP